jgi:hypothetical protein
MSEDKKTFEAIKPDQIVNVELSTNLYQRLNQYIIEMFPIKDEEHFLTLIKKVSQGDETDRLAYHLKTLITLQMCIEKSAREQDLVENLDSDQMDQFKEDFNIEENQSSPQ